MPKYSFVCQKCQEEFTVKTVFEEKWDAVCPICGGKEKREVFKPMGYGFKNDICRKMGIEIPPPGQFPK